jgi:hypothetical protein
VPPWFPITLQIIISVLAVVINAVINTKIKFAPNKEAATLELK